MIKTIATVLIALILAGWSVAIAILSVQNAFIIDEAGNPQLISLRFLGIESIQMPFGVALAIAFSIGVVIAALVLGWFGRSPKRQ